MLSDALIDKKSALPRHAQIEAYFRDLVESGHLKPGERIPPETNIAATLGVSRMTVNKAILSLTRAGLLVRGRGAGTFVASTPAFTETRLLVSVPMNLTAESDQHDYYYSPLYRAMHAEAERLRHQISLTYLPTGDFVEYQRKKQADAWLLIAPDERHLAAVSALAASGTPVVIVGACWPQFGSVSTIDSDNFAGARDVVHHLHGLGHDRIALLYAGPEASNTQDRRRGYRQSLAEASLAHRPEWEIQTESAVSLGPARAEIAALLSRPLSDRPTAIFAAGYYIALETLVVAEEVGLVVPSTLSVVGYDDPLAAQLVRPALTTVRQPLTQMGQAAVAQLDRELRRAPSGPVCTRFAPTLQIRGSSTSPPALPAFGKRQKGGSSQANEIVPAASAVPTSEIPREESSYAK